MPPPIIPSNIVEYDVARLVITYGAHRQVLLTLKHAAENRSFRFGVPRDLSISWWGEDQRAQILISSKQGPEYNVLPWDDSDAVVSFLAESMEEIEPSTLNPEFGSEAAIALSTGGMTGRQVSVCEISIEFGDTGSESGLSLLVLDGEQRARIRFEDPTLVEISNSGGEALPPIVIVDVSDRGLETRRWQVVSKNLDEAITFWAAGAHILAA